ncbi:hypothetical protein [Bosea sp. (in: a-proteobacteria)]|uniref:hypothetical protein n=1 Tax=Bosea sp. (in: a-proteobacteria) TaxID=1871050 RepID=UPI002B46C061|nr:hypothetical protein [Bosea sp. (in: a-proteobacteria)]WRH57906.1 MAG: hypothetical protein RSE11_23535 [Bosea sp. (in: a-proteobacteria)]
MTKSFTSTVAALTIALVAGSTFAPTAASAKDGRNARIAIGALAGIGGALLGATIVHGQPRHAEGRYDQRPVRFIEEAEEECFEKPIRRFDRYSGETIVVGYKTICR